MKAYKIIAGFVFLLLTVSIVATSAYTPQGEGFVQVQLFAVTEDREEIVIGNEVDFTLHIQNYWNDTMTNITITQTFITNIDLLSVAGQEVGEEGITALENITVMDDRSGKELQFTYINASASNFTANLEGFTLLEDEFFTIDFVLNFTETGNFNIAAPSISYYDHWGDLQTKAESQGTAVTINEVEVEPRRQYIPVFSTADPNYTYILGGFLAIFVLAVTGRMWHFKKPIST